ncbi:MAG: SDR family NAD(P)-dependent oxidoreductase [Nitrospinales bacterium]
MEKTLVVTGAGSGIGRAVARTLADRDFSLILLGRNPANLETTRQAVKHPERHQCFPCDIRDAAAIRRALEESQTRSLYAVVANAGVGGENHYGNGDRWREVVETNLTGSYHTVNECLPYLKKDPSEFKKIVFISSILARLGVPGYSAYCASKAGVLGLMRSLAAELSGDKILVNALCPGWVNTDMAREGLQGMADAMSLSMEEARRAAMAQVPLGKMSEPDEIAAMTAFLLSDAQNSITGQTLDINNGAMMP